VFAFLAWAISLDRWFINRFTSETNQVYSTTKINFTINNAFLKAASLNYGINVLRLHWNAKKMAENEVPASTT